MNANGTRVEIADLGDWGASALLSEYDAEDDVIRIDARAIAAIRAAGGDAEVDRFVACAIAHESFHRSHPDASEERAHSHASETTGADPRAFERIVRRGVEPFRFADARVAKRASGDTL